MDTKTTARGTVVRCGIGLGLSGGYAMVYLPREKGQGLIEYALILVLIAIIVITILTLLGEQIVSVFSNIVSALGS